MPRLDSIGLKPAYHKGVDDIAGEFYLPCMSAAQSYDRAVGYFSSTIYTLAWPCLGSFARRGGRMRVICAPTLSPRDLGALAAGYTDRGAAALDAVFRNEVQRLLDDSSLRAPTTILAALVALGVLDLRVALLSPDTANRLFHDKVGIFTDAETNCVVFKGSMNETWQGLAMDGNLESVDVFVSWAGYREAERVVAEQMYFEALWGNDYPGTTVSPFPAIARDLLLAAADLENWETHLNELCSNVATAGEAGSGTATHSRRALRPHQAHALEAWSKQGRRGILEHATGSGKTLTALRAIREAILAGEVPIVLVPSEILLEQWRREIADELGDLAPQVLICGGGHQSWQREGLLGPWTRPRERASQRIVLSTVQTACTSAFRSALWQGDHILLVADEVHRLGSPEHQQILTLDTGPRLGLSATPRRAGDPAGTDALLSYFGGVVPPPFALADAIRAGALTPYFYYVHPVQLLPDEQRDWDALTGRVGQAFARTQQALHPSAADKDHLRLLLIQRARIVKSAARKIPQALSILKARYERGQKWLVYCESQRQLDSLGAALTETGIPTNEYHSNMRGDRAATLSLFLASGGVLLSIRCLDEGVDIPATTHALILASSQNPREFIQRRGRVLRQAPGKGIAHLHDILVTPQSLAAEHPSTAYLESELARAFEFARSAANPSVLTDLERLVIRHSIDPDIYREGGIEDDTTSV